MQLVVNEWLPEYFRPTANRAEKDLLEKFLVRFMQRNDQIVVRRPSAFYNKIYRYAKDLQDNYEAVVPLRNFIKVILEDSRRCELIDDNEILLPELILERLTIGNYASDQYLFEAAIKTEERIIVTTDQRLIVQMQENGFFQVLFLENFLDSY